MWSRFWRRRQGMRGCDWLPASWQQAGLVSGRWKQQLLDPGPAAPAVFTPALIQQWLHPPPHPLLPTHTHTRTHSTESVVTTMFNSVDAVLMLLYEEISRHKKEKIRATGVCDGGGSAGVRGRVCVSYTHLNHVTTGRKLWWPLQQQDWYIIFVSRISFILFFPTGILWKPQYLMRFGEGQSDREPETGPQLRNILVNLLNHLLTQYLLKFGNYFFLRRFCSAAKDSASLINWMKAFVFFLCWWIILLQHCRLVFSGCVWLLNTDSWTAAASGKKTSSITPWRNRFST